MGVRTIIGFKCDFSDCKNGQTGPGVVEYCLEDVQANLAPAPPEAKNIVLFEWNGVKVCFCNRTCACRFFLPAGCELVPKKLAEFPKGPGWVDEEVNTSNQDEEKK